MTYRADLHCHSNYSDGSATPFEILDLAKKSGLNGLSITDHDTVEAYSDEVIAYAQSIGVNLFVGAEFSAKHRKTNVHILGYNLKRCDSLKTFCTLHKSRRDRRNRIILEKLTRLALPISEDELKQVKEEGTIGRPHIASLMLKKGYVSSIQEAFNRYIGEGRCCFDPGAPVSVEETVHQIHQAGGKAFIAHPHLIRSERTLHALTEMPFDGIECYYSLLRPDQEKRWLDLAEKKGWLISGGSDFHGDIKPQVTLGCSYVGREEVEKIFGSL